MRPAVVIAAATMVAVAACGGGGTADTDVSPSAVISAAGTTARATPTGSASADILGPGLLVGACGSEGRTVELIRVDPSNGSVLARRADPGSARNRPKTPLASVLCTPFSLTPVRAAVLSPDLSKLATSSSFPDGSVHAGYLDVATATFHDVAASLHGNGFTSSVTEDKVLGFSGDGKLLFHAGVPPDLSKPWDKDDLYWSAAPPGYQPQQIDQETAYAIPSPGGTDQVLPYVHDSHPDRPAMLVLPPGTPHATVEGVTSPNGFAPVLVGEQRLSCYEPRWLADTALLCADEIIDLTRKQLVDDPEYCGLSATAPCWQWKVPKDDRRPLLPPNQRSNHDWAPSPSGTSVAFVSGLANTPPSIFLIDTAPGSQPQELTIPALAGRDITLYRWS